MVGTLKLRRYALCCPFMGKVKVPVALLRQRIGKSANERYVGLRVVLYLVTCMEVEQPTSPRLW